MIATLHWPNIGDLGVLVVRRSESDLKSRIPLEPLIEAIAVAEVNERCRAEIISGASYWNRRPHADGKIVVVVVDILSKRKHRREHTTEENLLGASHAGNITESEL